MKTIAEIQARLKAIAEESKTADAAQLDALEAEVRSLNAEMQAIKDAAEKRKKIINQITEGAGEEGEMGAALRKAAVPAEPAEPVDMLATAEYRTAFLMAAMGKTLTAQQRALVTNASDSAGPAIPTITYNKILEKIYVYAPLINKIQLLSVNGNFRFGVEVGNDLAEKHEQGATIEAKDVDLIDVTLSAYEITKLIRISRTVEYTTVDSFENWLVDSLARAIGNKINVLILYGTGTGEATGVDAAVTWEDNVNQITIGATATANASDVLNLIGLLGEEYDPNAIFVMSKRTLMTVFLPLQDKSKDNIVTTEGGKYFVQGYPVETSANVPLGDAYLGDFYKYVGNMPQRATIESDVDLTTNTRRFLGSALFDGKVADTNAFVKLTKATA